MDADNPEQARSAWQRVRVAAQLEFMHQRAGELTPEQFVDKVTRAALNEKQASQEHFIDLCRLLGQPTRVEGDPTGNDYCFEKLVEVGRSAGKGSKGDAGFVDVEKAPTAPTVRPLPQ
jgi:hypothetical protein